MANNQEDRELAADYANYANGAQKQIPDAPHSRTWRNPRLILCLLFGHKKGKQHG